MNSTNTEIKLAVGSICIAMIVMALKYWAFTITGSLALYSDALESIVNVISGIVTTWAVVVSHKPADKNHPYGHHKAEYFAAVLEGILIVVAAIMIIHSAYPALFEPKPIKKLDVGMLINSAAGALNLIWALTLIKLATRFRSPALKASGWHVLSDVITSVGVLAGLFASQIFHMPLLDPLMAIIVALNILWQGWRIVSKSLNELMDTAVDENDIENIKSIIAQNAKGALEVHDLRTRVAARTIFIEFHLVVGETMTVSDAHKICDRLENALKKCYNSCQVFIHVEPEHEAKACGVTVL